jgi:hypothetical protein
VFRSLRELLTHIDNELASSAEGNRLATICAWDLLTRNLTAEQTRQLLRTRAFEVIGGATGRRYRIRHNSAFNVDLLNEQGLCVTSFCFRPRGDYLPMGDTMLAQKNALELFELEALKVANRVYPPPVGRYWPL